MIGALIMGALVGWIAGKLMGVEGGLLRNIIIGVVGSFVGSGLFSLLGFYAYGLLAQILTGVVGACVFIWVGRRLLHSIYETEGGFQISVGLEAPFLQLKGI